MLTVFAPSKAWERRRRCKEYASKPFVGILWVTNPTRQSLASSRKRVLRPVRVTHRAKRRQPVLKPGY
jgi:hypothetical protein